MRHETEAEMIARNVHEQDKRLKRALRRIDRTGDTIKPRWYRETLEINRYIYFGSPRPGVCKYNCYHLTEKGRAVLGGIQ